MKEGTGKSMAGVLQEKERVMYVCAHVITNVFVHVYMKTTHVVCVCVCKYVWCICVCVPLCFVCVGGAEGRKKKGGWGGGLQFNTRCLKSVGLTACHKTACLIESPGMSSPAVLMNPKPKGLMKRAPFAKTVPWFDLP